VKSVESRAPEVQVGSACHFATLPPAPVRSIHLFCSCVSRFFFYALIYVPVYRLSRETVSRRRSGTLCFFFPWQPTAHRSVFLPLFFFPLEASGSGSRVYPRRLIKGLRLQAGGCTRQVHTADTEFGDSGSKLDQQRGGITPPRRGFGSVKLRSELGMSARPKPFEK